MIAGKNSIICYLQDEIHHLRAENNKLINIVQERQHSFKEKQNSNHDSNSTRHVTTIPEDFDREQVTREHLIPSDKKSQNSQNNTKSIEKKKPDNQVRKNEIEKELSGNNATPEGNAERKTVYIVGDSILNGIQENGLKKTHNVKVRAHPGATTEDLVDHLNPILRKKTDLIIFHGGTNDLTNEVDTTRNIDRVVQCIMKKSPNTKLAISGIIARYDRKDLLKKVEEMNAKLANITNIHNIDFIDNKNLKEKDLSARKLHLNKGGNSILANNFINFLKTF